MNEPRFLSIEEVNRLHDLSLQLFGGTAGLRDAGLVESALGSARNAWHYGGDLFDVASSYAFHISQAQAFLDGNKRTAILSALVFLKENGFVCARADELFYDAMIAIAEKRMDKKGLADVFRTLSKKNLE